MVHIFKGSRDHQGISLVQVVWVIIISVINWNLAVNISLHESVHGLFEVRGEDKEGLESKLLQYLYSLR